MYVNYSSIKMFSKKQQVNKIKEVMDVLCTDMKDFSETGVRSRSQRWLPGFGFY